MQIGGINSPYSRYSSYLTGMSKKNAWNATNDNTADQLAAAGKLGSCQDKRSFVYQMERAKSYEEELERAKADNPQGLLLLQKKHDEDSAKSFNKVVENYEKYGSTQHNGVPINVDSSNHKMSVGDTSSGNVIRVPLSNGWTFEFNRDNMDQVAKMLDIFTPEDLNRILEAITKDNIAQNIKKEADDTAEGGETVGTQEEAEKSTESQAVQPPGELKKEEAASPEGIKAAEPVSEEGEKEEAKTTYDIMVNEDGSRQMVITTAIGKFQTVTKIELSPAKGDRTKGSKDALFEGRKFEDDILDVQMVSREDKEKAEKIQLRELEQPTQLQRRLGSLSYEANFMYA